MLVGRRSVISIHVRGFPALGRDFLPAQNYNYLISACISRNAVEALRFFDEGGTTHENYSDYFELLLAVDDVEVSRKEAALRGGQCLAA